MAIAEAKATAAQAKLPLTTVQQSLDQFDIKEGQWNLIVLSYMQFWMARQSAAELARIANGLAPGGLLVVEGFAAEDAPGGPTMGFQTNQLLRSFAERLKVVEYQDSSIASDWKLGTKNRVMKLIAEMAKQP